MFLLKIEYDACFRSPFFEIDKIKLKIEITIVLSLLNSASLFFKNKLYDIDVSLCKAPKYVSAWLSTKLFKNELPYEIFFDFMTSSFFFLILNLFHLFSFY